MNWFTVFSVTIPCIRCDKNLICIFKVYFLENNFWQPRLEHDNMSKYLGKVMIAVEGIKSSSSNVSYFSRSCYTNKNNIRKYAFLEDWIIKDIFSAIDSPEENRGCLKLQFVFTDELIEDSYKLESYKGNTYVYKTFKSFFKISDDIIDLKCDGKETSLHNIKKKFEYLASLNLLKLNKYILFINIYRSNEDGLKIEDEAGFKLCYFKNYSTCLENLLNFVSSLRCLSSIVDDSALYTPKSSKNFIGLTSSLKSDEFADQFHKKFAMDLERLIKKNIVKITNLNILKSLFDEFVNHIIHRLSANLILLPIGGKYNDSYYLKQIYDFIYKLIIRYQEDSMLIHYCLESSFVRDVLKIFDEKLNKLQETAMNSFCETYIHAHISNLIGREIKTSEDYVDVEKIVDDYCNMLLCIINLAHKIHYNCDKICYFRPKFIDNYFCRILKGIEIQFKYPAKFDQIKTKNITGKEIILEQDIDYFINFCGKLYCLSNTLKMKKIHEIEIISADGKYIKKFLIDEY